MEIRLVGVPLQDGARRMGSEMGPSAYRAAKLAQALTNLNHNVTDIGNITPSMPSAPAEVTHPNPKLFHLPEMCQWIETLAETAYQESGKGFPIFMGGDHAMSAGTVRGLKRYADSQNQPLFVLWLDAHSDYHTLDSTGSGNIHGTPVAYFTGKDGFDPFPKMLSPVREENVCLFGIRSVDAAERAALNHSNIHVCDMRKVDEHGVSKLIGNFLDRVAAANGRLHVSLDVDFLDPAIAPAVGTTVHGGATFREAHLIMEMVYDSGLATSLDLAELNPFLDERGKTAILMRDLTASLLGRQVVGRATHSYV